MNRSWQSRRRLLVLVGVTVVVVVMVVAALLGRSPRNIVPVADLMKQADAAAVDGKLSKALALTDQILASEAGHTRAMLLRARCLAALKRTQAAIDQLSQLELTGTAQAVDAAVLEGDLLFFDLSRPAAAVAKYRSALRQAPESVDANHSLAVLLAVTGQWWKHIPVRLSTFQQRHFQPMDLVVLALADKALLNPELAERMYRVSPEDPLVLLAAGRLAMEDERHNEAIALLERSVAKAPELLQAQVLLGTQYLNHQASLDTWLRQLPASADDHPSIWLLRGKWARSKNQPDMALRCFCESVARNPNHPDSLYQVARLLESADRSEDAAAFFDRAQRLQEFVNAVKAADASHDPAKALEAAELAKLLGNFWEAWAWAALAAAQSPPGTAAQHLQQQLEPRLATLALRRTALEFNPVNAVDYQTLPPFRPGRRTPSGPTTRAADQDATHVAFTDQAAATGLQFQYRNGSQDPAAGTRRMFEVMGGGVGVLDVDGDGSPDVYLTQGGDWEQRGVGNPYTDRLFLQRPNRAFLDVSDVAGIRDNEFSQGIAVGDLNSDGFPDLVVANIGPNRILLNNGDGTFQEASQQMGLTSSDWTTSCVVADFSGDGLSEVFFVNYLSGEDLFTRTCGPDLDQVCLPQQFPAAENRLFWNSGGPLLVDVTERSGINAANGKSLGVVTGRWSHETQLDLFVANDTVANFYFQNQGPAADGRPQFQEHAVVSGLALSGEGTVQACMGIAAGDADNDGHTDLFVTNFEGESNTLYRHIQDGTFEDATPAFRLRQPSLSRLGFGAQFIDADLDGWQDLAVANGHIDRYSEDERSEYQMRPQFFANQKSGTFTEVPADHLGDYFQQKTLGRSMATLDWNRDGRSDLIIGHLDAPVALLENTTAPHGNFLSLRVHGIQSSRDAIGTIVTLELQHQTMIRQLTAGDGFQASNERRLTFGLAASDRIQALSIQWPSGHTDRFLQPAINTRWLAVEGRSKLFMEPQSL